MLLVKLGSDCRGTQYTDMIFWTANSSYMTLIGVHEMHGQMHSHVTNLFAVSRLSQLAYLTVSHTHPLACNKLLKCDEI